MGSLAPETEAELFNSFTEHSRNELDALINGIRVSIGLQDTEQLSSYCQRFIVYLNLEYPLSIEERCDLVQALYTYLGSVASRLIDSMGWMDG